MVFTPRTAADVGLPYLYHYQPFNLDRLRPIIVDSKLYFSRPSAFNDPWDCKPCFHFDVADSEQVSAHADFFERSDRARNTHLSEYELLARARRLREDLPFLEACVHQMYGIHSTIDQQYRVYCLAGSPIVPLMWSHYSASHTGVCLKFSNDDFFGSAFQVKYLDRYPTLSLLTEGAAALEPLVTKSIDWSYEEEYRLIAQERSHAVGVCSLLTDNNLISFPPGSLKAVYLGCRMPDGCKHTMKELASLSPTPVALRETIQLRDRYGLLDRDL